MCLLRGLCVTNTFFKCKIHQLSWRHPWSRHWHYLYLVITRRAELSSILLTHSYHSADCDTEHSLVASKVQVALMKLYHSKKNGRPRINTCCASNTEKTEQFVRTLWEALTKESPIDDTIDSKWSYLRYAVYNAAITACGKKERKSANCTRPTGRKWSP